MKNNESFQLEVLFKEKELIYLQEVEELRRQNQNLKVQIEKNKK